MEIPSESGSETKETFKIVLLGGYVFIIVFFKCKQKSKVN